MKILNIIATIVAATSAFCAHAQGFTIYPKNGDPVTYMSSEVDRVEFEVNENPETVAPKIGDFYFSDGTWGTASNSAKTVIGIIYWLGDPTATDAALKREHPNCTHGLVVALDQKSSPWQKNYERYGNKISKWVEANITAYAAPCSDGGENDPLQEILGYNNTKAIEAFNAAEENADWKVDAVEYVVNYRSEVPAPASSSDWYLPSPKELSLLWTGEIQGTIRVSKAAPTMYNVIRPRILAAGGMEVGDLALWSSTENKKDSFAYDWWTAWNYYFEEDIKAPLSGSVKDWSEYACARAILAF
jgi:hypothetical protein